MVRVHFLLSVRGAQQIDKILREFLGELLDVFLGVLADQKHLADMAFALDTKCKLAGKNSATRKRYLLALESVLVSVLLLTEQVIEISEASVDLVGKATYQA